MLRVWDLDGAGDEENCDEDRPQARVEGKRHIIPDEEPIDNGQESGARKKYLRKIQNRSDFNTFYFTPIQSSFVFSKFKNRAETEK